MQPIDSSTFSTLAAAIITSSGTRIRRPEASSTTKAELGAALGGAEADRTTTGTIWGSAADLASTIARMR